MKTGKFVSLGESRSIGPMTDEVKTSKTRIDYPSVTVDAANFPYLSKEEVGETCMVVVKVRKHNESLPDSYDRTQTRKIRLDLMEMAETKGEGKETDAGSAKKVAGGGY